MSLYQNNGDLVKIPSNTLLIKREVLEKQSNPYIRKSTLLLSLVYGVIVESFDVEDIKYYEMLVGEEYWCAKAEEVHWAGA